MTEMHIDRVHTENVVLDIGGEIGALIIYTGAELRDREIELSLTEPGSKRFHNEVHERRLGGRTLFAAVYPEIHAGDYHIWGDGREPIGVVTIRGGEVSTLDWS